MSALPRHEEIRGQVLSSIDVDYNMYVGMWRSPSKMSDLRERRAIRRALSEMGEDMRSRYMETVAAIDRRLYSVLKRNGKV